MKRYKVKEVIELLEADGWVKVKTKGDTVNSSIPQKQER